MKREAKGNSIAARWSFSRTVLAAALALATARRPLSADDRLPVPTQGSRAMAADKVNDVFGVDIAKATTSQAKAAMASELLACARSTANADECYALLVAAIRLGIDAGDVNGCLETVDEFSGRFRVDAEDVHAETLEALASKAPAQELPEIVDRLLTSASREAASQHFEDAERILKTAAAATRRTRNKTQQEAVLAQLADVREQAKAVAKMKQWRDRVQADPNDSEAALQLGKHLCFSERDWKAGLPLLAKGSDVALGQLARDEMDERISIIAMADAWWRYAESQKGASAAAAFGRAVTHYRTAAETLTGLDKARAEKRVAAALQAAAGPDRPKTARPSHLVMRLDASALGSLHDPEGKALTAKAATPQRVGTWLDAYGGPANAKSPDAPGAPTLVREGISGKPSVEFTGKERLTIAALLPRDGTLIVVAQARPPVANGCVLGPLPGGGIDLWIRDNFMMFFTVFPKQQPMHRHNTDPNSLPAEGAFVTAVSWRMPILIRINGRVVISKNDPESDPSGATGLVVGAADNAGRYPFVGSMGEILLFDKQLEEQDLTALEKELMAKWRIQR